MKPYTLHLGDCLEVLRGMADNSIDAIVTDPPYGLSSEPDMAEVLRHWLAGDDYQHKGSGFMGKSWDSFVPGPSVWREAMRVLKPGGHLLAFFGSRTYDLGTLAIRLAGFEVRDQIMWVYGSGFPKSLDVSKAIDKAAGADREVLAEGKAVKRMIPGADQNATGSWIKDNGREYVPTVTAPATDTARQWEGWGTALKPAHEPICVARKPLVGTVAANVLEFGTGALNIDGCRVPTEEGGRPMREVAPLRDGVSYSGNSLAGRVDGSLASSKAVGSTDTGRWPANLIHDGSDEVVALFPHSSSGAMKASTQRAAQDKPGSVCFGTYGGAVASADIQASSGSAARFFYCAKASRADRNEGLEDPGPQFKRGTTLRQVENTDTKGNTHPTVKPTELMAYLVRLVTPPGGLVLDPFMGSGSTGKAAMREGFQFIGIDMTPEYVDIATARIEHELARVTAASAPPPPEPQLDLFGGAYAA